MVTDFTAESVSSEAAAVEWSVERCTMLKPTDSWGSINFKVDEKHLGNVGPKKFVRMAHPTDLWGEQGN